MNTREIIGILTGLIIIGLWGFRDYMSSKKDNQNK